MLQVLGFKSSLMAEKKMADLSRKKWKTIVCRHKSQKKSLLKMWSKKKFVVEIDEKCVDQKKHQMVT